ncbi:DNA-directed RNA polymerases II IV and V subunit 8B [Zea mays]|nr:DNA-directed RNA polymerases II IV and V subunit 8B [Zea mays]
MLLGRKTLVDDYEYIMLGKLFKVSKDSTKDGNGNSSTKVLFMYGHTKAKGRHNTAVKVVSPSQKQPLCI